MYGIKVLRVGLSRRHALALGGGASVERVASSSTSFAGDMIDGSTHANDIEQRASAAR